MLLKIAFWMVVVGLVYARIESKETEDSSEEESRENESNETVAQDLYVIKTVVYEVGILTDASNDTNDTETQEEVDVSFFNPSSNGSGIDLSNIPVPIQTNISGVTVTGVLPGSNLAALLLPATAQDGTPLIPKTQIKVTQNISTSDPGKGSEIISNLPRILGLEKTGKEEEND